MKLFLFLVFSICVLNTGFSQKINSSLTGGEGFSFVTRPVSTADGWPGEVHQKKIVNDYEGSIHLFDTWETTAMIVTNSGKELRINNLNFNLKDQRFETRILGDSLFIFNNDKIKYVQAQETSFIKLKNPKSNNVEFFETLLNLEHITLYKHAGLDIRNGILNPLTQQQLPDVYSTSFSYFYTKNNSNLLEIKLKKKDILKAFSNKKNEIIIHAKENDLWYDTEEGLIKILTYYNSL
ncbi:hypothetical protein [Formosa maritima]|uniref:Uncharacterized protein n=1 Tax=Formosa maritima TaxID=2592046 RepID=A0A5D0G399_9FLAO|nr:hypothetical protein [Formosa maritima]TYA53308.1 hypothetical protein FVF61_11725 [Formosa maritima]